MILFYASLVNPTRLLQETISRNAIDLGYKICKQLDRNLIFSSAKKKELDTLKETITTLHCQQLELYLQGKEWEKADRETKELILYAVGKDSVEHLFLNDLRNFPGDDLLAIDGLWTKYSNGHYGFSIQKQIYVECGGKLDFSSPSSETWNKFCDRTAWKSEGKLVDYPQPFFDNNFMREKGHLPLEGGSPDGVRGWREHSGVVLLFSHRDL